MLSIIILNYNQKNLCRICLDNLKQAKLDLKHEIIITDNGSTDKSKAVLMEMKEKYPDLQLIFNEKNLGYARANNQAIKQTQGDYILILNPDVIVAPGSIEKLLNFLKNNSKIGLIGPQLLNPDETVQYSCYRFPKIHTPLVRRTFLGNWFFKKELARYLMLDFDHKKVKEVDWLIGACLMFSKEIFQKLGGFDERYFLYFEDVDLARKIKQAGYKVVYLFNSQMIHFHRRLSADFSTLQALKKKITWVHIVSALKYFWKWKGKNWKEKNGQKLKNLLY